MKTNLSKLNFASLSFSYVIKVTLYFFGNYFYHVLSTLIKFSLCFILVLELCLFKFI